jgi:hypothetical protein
MACLEARSPLKRAIATEADHKATGIRLVEKGEAVLEVMGIAEGRHAEVYDPNAPCQLQGGRSVMCCGYTRSEAPEVDG